MQNSELYRRGIVLPLDENAEVSLRHDDVEVTTRVQYLQIDTDSLFDGLWQIELFRAINYRCNTLIDDYEQEFVESSDVMEISAAIEVILLSDIRPDLKHFLFRLQALCIKASEISRPVLFVL